jgi:hypothetical protein
MPTILKKHLDKDARRVIVFCGNIESLGQMHDEVVGWFRKAGFTVVSTCIMHSDLTDREQREQMDRFEDDTDGKGVKLMFSVNMLNEGVHVPNVNAVLMLRTTSSRIIYMQQMGRCLTAANTEKPLVLDMVDNITTTTAIKGLQDEFEILERETADSEGREPRKFEVKDYTLGVRDLIEKLAPATSIPFEERITMATAFCEKHGRPPGKRDELEEYRNWCQLVTNPQYRNHPEMDALMKKYGKPALGLDDRIHIIEEFTAQHGRLPSKSKEVKLYYIWKTILKNTEDDPRVVAISQKYTPPPFPSLDEKIQMIQEFVTTNGRKPHRTEKKIYQMWASIREQGKGDPRVEALRDKYERKVVSLEERITFFQKFIQEHGRCPKFSETKLYNQWSYMLRHQDDPRIKDLVISTRPKSVYEQRIEAMTEFTEKFGRKPVKSDGDSFKVCSYMLQWGRYDPRVIALKEKYGGQRKQQRKRIDE